MTKKQGANAKVQGKRDWGTAAVLERRLQQYFQRKEKHAKGKEKKLVSVKIEMFFLARTAQEKCRASVITRPDGAELCPRHKLRIACRRYYVSNIPAIVHYGSIPFEKLVYVIVQHSTTFAGTYANVGSHLEAIGVTIEGELPEGEPADDYESTQPLAEDQYNQSVSFPYIKSGVLFEKRQVENADNEEPNSCLATLIIKTFKKSFADHKMLLNYKTLWTICCPNRKLPREGEGYQLKLQEAEAFFRLYRLKLVAVDIFMKGVHYYDPRDSGANLNTHMQPSILRVLKHHNHVYLIDKNVKSFDQKVKHMFDKTTLQLPPTSSNFFIRSDFDSEADQVINDFEMLMQYIKSYDGKASRVRIITDLFIEETLIMLKEQYGVVATSLQLKNNMVVGFQLESNGTVFVVCQMRVPENEPDQAAQTKEQYDTFMKHYERIYKELINKNHLSFYNPQFANVLRMYSRGPLTGCFTDNENYCDRPAPYIDMVKAYTARILELKHFPVFDQFCVFKKHESGTKLEDYGIYLAHRKAETDQDFLIFDRKYVLVSGLTLKQTKIECDILYSCLPCKLVPNTIRTKVQELWEEEGLGVDDKKFIVNVCLGWLDKACSQRSRCEYFEDAMEAKCKMRSMKDAQFVPIRSFAKYSEEGTEYMNPLDDGIDFPTASMMYEKVEEAKMLYLVVQTSRQMLENGFLPMSFFKYDLQRLALWKMYGTLKEAGIRIMGINTDCFYLERNGKKVAKFVQDHPELIATSSDFASIGKWRVDHDKRCRPCRLQQQQNALVVDDVAVGPSRTYNVVGERTWDRTKTYMKNVMKELAKGNTLILADYPGCGKTYLMEQFTKDKKHIIVVPHNNLKEDLKKKGKKAMTVHKLLGLGVDERHQANPVSVKGIKVIAWDELLLNSRRVLWKIYEFMQANPQIHFLASTDPYQLKAVEDSSHFVRSNVECLDFLFHHRMTLHVIKRVKDPADREAYPIIKRALFEEKLCPMDVLLDHSEYFGKIVTRKGGIPVHHNISAFNDTRHAVNHHVHRNVLNKTGLFVGDSVVCKGYVKAKCKQRTKTGVKVMPHKAMTRNRVYEISKIVEGEVELQDPYLKTRKYWVTHKEFRASFDKPYCMTNHAVIGTTIDQPIMIHDLDNVDARWFWTAISRATSLKNVNFYLGPELVCEDFGSIIKSKLYSHKRYDQKRGIYDEKNFVTAMWVKNELKRMQWRCSECQVALTNEKKSKHHWSIDRLDNDLGHTKTNCRITCLHCNNAKH